MKVFGHWNFNNTFVKRKNVNRNINNLLIPTYSYAFKEKLHRKLFGALCAFDVFNTMCWEPLLLIFHITSLYF